MGTWSKRGLALMLLGIFLLLIGYISPPIDAAFAIEIVCFDLGFSIMLVGFDKKPEDRSND